MDMLCFYKDFETKCHTIYRIVGAKKSHRHCFNMLNEHGIPIKRLSDAQKKEVDNLWGVGGGTQLMSLCIRLRENLIH